MTFTKTATLVALVFGIITLSAPMSADAAINAPRCVFNTIVQPSNNGGTTLSWKAYDAHTVTITNIGSVTDADAVVVYPSVPTTYTLNAYGYGGTTTCTVTAQPVSSYSFNNTNIWNAVRPAQTCSLWVNPDYVVPGGTGILSWNAGNAARVSIDQGIGNVGNTGSRVVPNTGFSRVFNLRAEWGNGVVKTCSATMNPVGVVAPTYSPTVPTVTATYVALNQVPYTGTNDVAYILTLLAVVLGILTLLYAKRDTFRRAMMGE